jgi:hypothetical protein
MTRTALLATATPTATLARAAMPETDAIRSAALAACGIVVEAENPTASAVVPVELSPSLASAREEVLAAARRMRTAYHRQHELRVAATYAENDWTVTCFSTTASKDEVRRANRVRREAQRVYEEAWHAYQAAAQHLCRVTEWLAQLEAQVEFA